MHYGVAWYPEHWPEARWPEDLQLMRAAGINTVRICDFAWSTLEPQDGVFELDLFERAIGLAGQFGLSVIVATPSASPPAWLTQAHPDTLAVNQDGVRYPHGGRCHYNVASAPYRRYARRMARRLGERFGNRPEVIAWQIDNEYNRVSYDVETKSAFQAWLQQKYGSLEQLNRRWWTRYWSESYSAWVQIPLPMFPSTEHPWMVHNPGLRLDFRRFVTELYAGHQRAQLQEIRASSRPEQVFTHNFMGWFDLFDHYALSADLDVAGFDNYIGDGHLDFTRNGAQHDLTRGFKRKNHWVLETQAGATNHGVVNNALNKGEIRTLVYHQIGHGADLVAYWQWRSALGGQEQYWGNILHPDGTPRPHYQEIQQISQELTLLAPALENTAPVAEVAILHSYEDRWALNFQRQQHDFDPVEHLLSYYRPLREGGVDVDIVHPSTPLERYRLVLAPHLHLLTPVLVQRLTSYVEQGGHLVLGPRSGMKDEDNALLASKQPGGLSALAGVQVEQYYPLGQAIPVVRSDLQGSAIIWSEQLKVLEDDVEVLATYGISNGWLDGQPAVTSRVVGMGRTTVIGAWMDDVLMKEIILSLLSQSDVPATWTLPTGVELCRRAGEGRELTLYINHSSKPKTVSVEVSTDLLSGAEMQGKVILLPHGVLVLQAAKTVPQTASQIENSEPSLSAAP